MVKSFKRSISYGLAIWAIPFVIAILIGPLRENERPLFESIMPVVVTISVVIFTILYFQKIDSDFLKEGAILGLIWIAINIIIDLLMFSSGPMKMTFIDYVKDIGITYLIIPTTTLGFGYFATRKLEK